MSKKYNVAVVGATGAVGEVMLELLQSRNFPIENIYPLASERSAGGKVMFNGKAITVTNLAEFDFAKADIALFSAGGDISEIYAPIAAKANCVVIDNTSHFRYHDDVPLVVPEVNPDALKRHKNIIANPNCSTIGMLVALKPIHDVAKITRINVATYQAVSGAGKAAINELAGQTANLLNAKKVVPEAFPVQIAFNVIPQIDVFLENGYTKEEMKMVWETKKILEDDTIEVNPTAVRVPVFYGHSEAIHIEMEKKLTREEATKLLSKAPGVKVVDKREPAGYATAITHSSGKDPVYVSRIREDISHPSGLNLWVVSDNIRKGAALNSIQIAEKMMEMKLL